MTNIKNANDTINDEAYNQEWKEFWIAEMEEHDRKWMEEYEAAEKARVHPEAANFQ